jgi:uracil-DNA glycosylase
MGSTFPDRAPPCFKCAHFSITFNPSFPRACRMFGVQTAGMPSQEVFLATGKHCPQYVENPKLKKS